MVQVMKKPPWEGQEGGGREVRKNIGKNRRKILGLESGGFVCQGGEGVKGK